MLLFVADAFSGGSADGAQPQRRLLALKEAWELMVRVTLCYTSCFVIGSSSLAISYTTLICQSIVFGRTNPSMPRPTAAHPFVASQLDCGVSLDHYCTYAHLKRLGFIVRR